MLPDNGSSKANLKHSSSLWLVHLQLLLRHTNRKECITTSLALTSNANTSMPLASTLQSKDQIDVPISLVIGMVNAPNILTACISIRSPFH
jgi:hypothetical protein